MRRILSIGTRKNPSLPAPRSSAALLGSLTERPTASPQLSVLSCAHSSQAPMHKLNGSKTSMEFPGLSASRCPINTADSTGCHGNGQLSPTHFQVFPTFFPWHALCVNNFANEHSNENFTPTGRDAGRKAPASRRGKPQRHGAGLRASRHGAQGEKRV